MIVDILKKHSGIIEFYNVSKFSMTENSFRLVYDVKLKDGTLLFVRDYLFQDGTRKYSFHWQNAEGNCIIRWDNAPHHQAVSTFPYHKHIGKNEIISHVGRAKSRRRPSFFQRHNTGFCPPHSRPAMTRLGGHGGQNAGPRRAHTPTARRHFAHPTFPVFTNGPQRLSRPVFCLRSAAFEFSRRMPYVLIFRAAIFKIPLIGGHHAGRD
jgi:hypothetical protein